MNEQENVKIEIPNITNPVIALQLIFQGIDHANKRGIFSLNDSSKLHSSLICLVKALKDLEIDTEEKQ